MKILNCYIIPINQDNVHLDLIENSDQPMFYKIYIEVEKLDLELEKAEDFVQKVSIKNRI